MKCSSYYFASNPHKNDSISIDALGALGMNVDAYGIGRSSLQVIPDCTLTLTNPEAQTSTALLMSLAEKKAFSSPSIVNDTSGTITMLASIADYICEGHFERDGPDNFRSTSMSGFNKPQAQPFNPYPHMAPPFMLNNPQAFSMAPAPINQQQLLHEQQMRHLTQQHFMETQMLQAQMAQGPGWRPFPLDDSTSVSQKLAALQAIQNQTMPPNAIQDPIALQGNMAMNMSQSLSSMPSTAVAMQLARMQQIQDQHYINARQNAMAAMQQQQLGQRNVFGNNQTDNVMQNMILNPPLNGMLTTPDYRNPTGNPTGNPAAGNPTGNTDHRNPVMLDSDQRSLLSDLTKKSRVRKRTVKPAVLLGKAASFTDSDSEDDESTNQQKRQAK